MEETKNLTNLPNGFSSDAFTIVGERKMTDEKPKSKPVGYFKDAWRRFKKNKASVVALCIIVFIVLFALLTPLLNYRYSSDFLDTYYAKKAPRSLVLRPLGIFNGEEKMTNNESALFRYIAIGMGAEDKDGSSAVSVKEGKNSYYQPVIKIGEPYQKNGKTRYDFSFDSYFAVGFLYMDLEQSEYARIKQWETESGLKVIYPTIDVSNEYYYGIYDSSNPANYWYKAVTPALINSVSEINKNAPTAETKAYKKYLSELEKGTPLKTVGTFTDGNGNSYARMEACAFGDDAVLEGNYLSDGSGNVADYVYSGGGTESTAMYRVRVLYYNYYRYKNGFEPEYFLGTDSQGYDLALRLAQGIRLSLVIALFVCVINFVVGALYGATEGYFGGTRDIVMERIAEILSGVPFIIVATLFQIHLSAKVGAIPSLLFAFVLTGWIGTASSVRTQFYRYKNQEYVLSARTLGARDRRIMWKHIFPNTLGTIITSVALDIPSVIFSESMLSFLGIIDLGGAKQTSLGTLLSDASSVAVWTAHPHLMLLPAIVISLLMISFNLFGNGLRDAFNPVLRGSEN